MFVCKHCVSVGQGSVLSTGSENITSVCLYKAIIVIHLVLSRDVKEYVHTHTHTQSQATLNSGLDLKQAVKLPDDEDYNDWVAVNVVDFFNRINIIYGTVCEYCTDRSCPLMSGGPKFEYYWADEVQKKPLALSAPDVSKQWGCGLVPL